MATSENDLIRKEKAHLCKLIEEAEGFDDPEALIEECLFGSSAGIPGICLMCEGVFDMEPDNDEAWCDCCGDNTGASYLVLKGLI